MGQYFTTSRQGRVEELNIASNAVYRYPPKSGSYFDGQFVMGGKEFESIMPEAYLFGENSDLNFLTPNPQQFPYKSSTTQEPIKALRCLVNIRKDSLRLVKVASPIVKPQNQDGETAQQIIPVTDKNGWFYNIEFTFDADCPCLVTIYYNASEEVVNNSVIYTSEPVNDCSATMQYQAGCNQQFCLPSHMIHDSKLKTNDGSWNTEFKKIPVVIQVLAQNGPDHVGHSHITYAEFYKPADNTWSIRAVKQKQAEIYGIEHKKQNAEQEENVDDSEIDCSNSECVVCLSETRDTLILPCKHLCLCSSCANQLRYQQSGCPICRQSFRALLQIRAVRKKDPNADRSDVSHQSEENVAVDIETSSQDLQEIPIPDGYEVVSLIDTVNGTLNTTVSSDDLSASPSHVYAEIASLTSEVVTENETAKPQKSSKNDEDKTHSEQQSEDNSHDEPSDKPLTNFSKEISSNEVVQEVETEKTAKELRSETTKTGSEAQDEEQIEDTPQHKEPVTSSSKESNDENTFKTEAEDNSTAEESSKTEDNQENQTHEIVI